MNVGKLAADWGRNYKVALLFERDGGKCWICGSEMRFHKHFANEPNYATIDHIVPKSLGGTNGNGNLKLACRTCNCERGNDYNPSMGGISRRNSIHKQMLKPKQSLEVAELWFSCRICKSRYMVLGIQTHRTHGLCAICYSKYDQVFR